MADSFDDFVFVMNWPSINSILLCPDSFSFSIPDKHLWIKKATGLGVTEFEIYGMALSEG